MTSVRAKLPRDVARYLARAYPKNHTYRIVGGRLVPTWKLASRYRRIRALYPEGAASLVDLATCKGWFCLHAAQRLGMTRVLGIELFPDDLRAARAARAALAPSCNDVLLEDLRLHELDARIEEFGGPFDVALVVNLYHYLFFGSKRSDGHYDSHAAIFGMLRRIASRAVVFSGCTEVDHLPRHMQAMAHEQGRADLFHEAAIRSAAEEHFSVEEHGSLGKRPLWRLVPRSGSQR